MKLAALLEEASTASPATRIEWRDPIAAYGPRAIEGVRPWLSDDELARFAIRVIERAGQDGEAALAAKVLRAARKKVPASAADDIVWALKRLKSAPQSSRPTETRADPSDAGTLARTDSPQTPASSHSTH